MPQSENRFPLGYNPCACTAWFSLQTFCHFPFEISTRQLVCRAHKFIIPTPNSLRRHFRRATRTVYSLCCFLIFNGSDHTQATVHLQNPSPHRRTDVEHHGRKGHRERLRMIPQTCFQTATPNRAVHICRGNNIALAKQPLQGAPLRRHVWDVVKSSVS